MKIQQYLPTNRIWLLLHILTFLGMAQQPAAREFPYQLYNADILVSSVGVITFGTGTLVEYLTGKSYKAPTTPFNPATVSTFDRSATTMWHPVIDKAGDVAVAGLFMAPAVAGLGELKARQWSNLFTLAGIYGETVFMALSVGSWSKVLVERYRPYSYNTAIPTATYEALIHHVDARRSFLSMHTTLAFSASVFLSTAMADIYGPGWRTFGVQASALTAATAIGVSRVLSGQHFPTDVLAGAAVGGAIGFLVPRMHRIGSQVAVGFSGEGIWLGWRL